MSKIITFSGPSGVGKTTMAEWLAKELRLPFIPTSTKSLWPEYGIKDHADLIQKSQMDPLGFGIKFQFHVLKMRDRLIREHEFKGAVMDRGLLDSWVYCLLELGPYISEETFKEFWFEAQRINTFTTHNIIIRYDNQYKLPAKDGARIANHFFQTHVQLLFDHYAFRLQSGTQVKMKTLQTKKLDDRKVEILGFLNYE